LLVSVAVYSAPQGPADRGYGEHEVKAGRVVAQYWRSTETFDELKEKAGEEALYSGLSELFE